MAIMKWEPRRELNSVERTMRRIFEDFDNNFLNVAPATRQSAFVPAFDINEDKENLYFIADLPGLKPENVKVTVSDGVLTVRGEKKREESHQNRNFYRLERSHGEFVRQFTLPQDVRDEDILANFEHGVLEIQVPKREPAKPKEREVRVGSGSLKSNGANEPSGNGQPQGFNRETVMHN